MSAIIEFLVNPAVQMIMWIIAGIVILYFRQYMSGVIAWNFIAVGIILYGVRIGIKLVPSLSNSIFRYSLGLIGLVILFSGVIMYYYNNVKPLIEVS